MLGNLEISTRPGLFYIAFLPSCPRSPLSPLVLHRLLGFALSGAWLPLFVWIRTCTLGREVPPATITLSQPDRKRRSSPQPYKNRLAPSKTPDPETHSFSFFCSPARFGAVPNDRRSFDLIRMTPTDHSLPTSIRSLIPPMSFFDCFYGLAPPPVKDF